jgi:hypothetical protein
MDLSSNDNVCRQGIANMKLYKPMVDRVERRQRVRAVWAPPEVVVGAGGGRWREVAVRKRRGMWHLTTRARPACDLSQLSHVLLVIHPIHRSFERDILMITQTLGDQ